MNYKDIQRWRKNLRMDWVKSSLSQSPKKVLEPTQLDDFS